MKLNLRVYQTEDDYWKIRAFLREVFLLNDRQQHSWDVVRFDYWRWHVALNCHEMDLQKAVYLWETPGGELAAVLCPEGPGGVHLHVHPAYASPQLDSEMIETAEECLSVPDENGKRTLQVWIRQDNPQRQAIVQARGYAKGDWPEYQRSRPMSLPVADVKPAPGYHLRPMGDVDELPARSLVSWFAFHADEPFENFDGHDGAWYRNMQRCPLYRRDLDIVGVSAEGELVSFCTVWFDDVCRIGVFEPVGVHPAHQRKGLGKAMMAEGLRQLQRLGAVKAFVGSYSVEAGATYAGAGFTEYTLSERWIKAF